MLHATIARSRFCSRNSRRCIGHSASANHRPCRLCRYATRILPIGSARNFQGNHLRPHLGYWKKKLAAPPLLGLPGERAAGVTATYAGARCYFSMSRALAQDLKNLSRRYRATLFMTLLAAFKILLCRYTGQTDILVGTPVSQRDRAELQPLVGVFVNTLALRTDCAGDPGFEQLLGRVRDTVLEAQAHREPPFMNVIRGLGRERRDELPFIQAFFDFQSTALPRLEQSDLRWSPLDFDPQTAPFELTLHMTDIEGGLQDEGLQGYIEYRKDRFEPEFIEAMVGHLRSLLAGVAADPQRALSALPLLSPAERQNLLAMGDGGRVDYPWERTIPALFAEQAARRPAATALIFEERSLSYRELARRSDRLAAQLQAYHLVPGEAVGLCCERSPALVAAVLGILKAGAAVLPLDPGYPDRRLAFMLDDAGPRVLVTRKSLSARLSVSEVQHTLFLDDDIGDTKAAVFTPDPEQPAFVIFTSGSTGQPKGVVLPHRQLLNRLHWMWRSRPFAAGEVTCQKTPLNFVDAIGELFGGLLQGVPTVIAPDAVVKDAPAFVDLLDRHRVSRLWLVPSLLDALLEAVPELCSRLPALRFWVSSGEALPVTVLQRFRRLLPGCVLYNLYGATEAWDVACSDTDVDPESAMRVPIGRPLPNMQVYILDSHLQPVPAGGVGDLYVGGRGLALGFLNRPDLSAERFLADPFAAAPAARIYRSGDLARFRPDGAIDYLGRRDQQFKLRGVRIEPAEIERALTAHPAVLQAAVALKTTAANDHRLVAYIVARGMAPTSTDLAAFLAARLPASMLPADYIVLPSLPVNPSGKLDRLRLPEPAERPADSYAPPRNEIENTLVDLWQLLLATPRLGIHDDFFALGGHSLLAVNLLAQIREIFGKTLPLAALLATPTVAGLAARLLDDGRISDHSAPLLAHGGGGRIPLFGVCGSHGYALRLMLIGRALDVEQPFYGLEPPAMDWAGAGCERIEDMAAWYVQRMRAVQADGPYRLLGTSFGGVMVFEIALQLQQAGLEIDFLGLLDTHPPTCRLPAGRLDSAPLDTWEEWILAESDDPITRKGIETAGAHYRALQRYLLEREFKGRLTYFCCTGYAFQPAVDRRRLWLCFADDVRVITLPGLHSDFFHEPQFSAFRDSLEACLADRPLANAHPGEWLRRAYRLIGSRGAATIASSDGRCYTLRRRSKLGHLDTVRAEQDGLFLKGWAAAPDRRAPADVIVVFADGEYLCSGGCGFERTDVASKLGKPGLRYAGFVYRVPWGGRKFGEIRAFVLDDAVGEAYELLRPRRWV